MSLAALSLAACSNDEDAVPQTSSVVVNLSSTAPKTKATTSNMALASLDAEKNIATGTLYVFENDVFFTSVTITSANTDDKGNTSVTIPGLTVAHTYSFAAVVNPGENNITATTKAGLRAEVIALSGKGSGDFVMYGESADNLTVAESGSSTLSVEVKRVLSGVQLVSVETDFAVGTPVFATEGTAVVKSLQLLQTNPSSALNGAVKAAATDAEKINGVDATFGDAGISIDYEKGTNINVTDNSVRAYCCPGKVGYVVLNVTYTYQGKTYDRTYNIPTLSNINGGDGVVANYLYGLKVTLTGAGSEEGGNPEESANATATLTVADWYDGTVIEVNQGN